jgi:hypothetical protein
MVLLGRVSAVEEVREAPCGVVRVEWAASQVDSLLASECGHDPRGAVTFDVPVNVCAPGSPGRLSSREVGMHYSCVAIGKRLSLAALVW